MNIKQEVKDIMKGHHMKKNYVSSSEIIKSNELWKLQDFVLPSLHAGCKNYIEVPPDFQVYVLILTEHLSGRVLEVKSKEMYKTLETANNHWWKTATWLSKEDKESVRIVCMSFYDRVKEIHQEDNWANPFERIDEIEFLHAYRQRWNLTDTLPISVKNKK
jgi:hypothetical protein